MRKHTIQFGDWAIEEDTTLVEAQWETEKPGPVEFTGLRAEENDATALISFGPVAKAADIHRVGAKGFFADGQIELFAFRLQVMG